MQPGLCVLNLSRVGGLRMLPSLRVVRAITRLPPVAWGQSSPVMLSFRSARQVYYLQPMVPTSQSLRVRFTPSVTHFPVRGIRWALSCLQQAHLTGFPTSLAQLHMRSTRNLATHSKHPAA